MPDPHRAEGPRGVVDQVAQRLRHRRPRHRAEELVQLDGGPAGVERAAYRARREAVDGRPAARLHVGDQLEPPGQLRTPAGPGATAVRSACSSTWSTGSGSSAGERLLRRLVARRPAARGRTTPARPSPVTPERRGLGQRPEHLVGAGPRAARPLPAQQRDQRRARRCPAARHSPVGERRRARPASSRRVSAMCTPASSGASAFQALPAGSREPTRPGIRGLSSQVRASPAQRSAGGRSTQVSTRSVGSQTGLPSRSAAVASSPAEAAVSTSSATVASSRCSAVAVALQVAHAQAAAAQRGRRLGAPQVEQQLQPAYRLERRAAGHARRPAARIARSWPGPGTSSTGSTVVRPPRSASPTSPGTTTVPVPRGTSSRRESSSSAGVAASSGSTVCRPPSVVASPPAASTCSSIARAGSDSSAEPRRDLGRLRGRARSTAAAR